ncbi:MAG: AAA family ATPase, partial [Asticcacaulis sp.]
MNEYSVVRAFVLRIARDIAPTSGLAKRVVTWAEPHAEWLMGEALDSETPLDIARIRSSLEAVAQKDEVRPHVLNVADELGRLLQLCPFEARLLTLIIACDRLPKLKELLAEIVEHVRDFPALLGEIAGAEPIEAAARVRRSEVMKLGLITFEAQPKFNGFIDIVWPLNNILDRDPSPEALTEALAGRRQPADLGLDDFSHVPEADFLLRLLQGALRERAQGVNILIHGPPGGGKTELARTLAMAAGCTLYGVGEADDDGNEPDRRDRVRGLLLAQRVLKNHNGAVLLFDEMEDLIGDTTPSQGDWFSRREGSKVFINRLLETNVAPVIWVTNAIGNIDDAILRRMSFVLKLDLPPRRAAHRMLQRIAGDEQIQAGQGLDNLIDQVPEASSVLRTALRAGRLAGEADCGTQAARSLVRALRGNAHLPDAREPLDMQLYETSRPLDALFDSIRQVGALDVSLLLTGPPGTGKTALAHHLAHVLERPLLVKRASDLMSKWVGETEQNIAGAFEEARRQEGVLLFDEADSLLFDRTRARLSWEVGQVNEMLTWLDRHPYPV